MTIGLLQPRGTKRFFYHYNKAESRKHGKTILTVHFNNICHMVNKVFCAQGVPFESHHQKKQPNCIIRGWCKGVILHHNEDGEVVGNIF